MKSLGLHLKDNMRKSELIDLISTKNLNSDINGLPEGEYNNKDLESMTIVELREVAKKLDNKSLYKYKKKELMDLINDEIKKKMP